MARVYFTKSLPQLDLAGWISFCKDAGIDGLDLAVRPKYPVNPDNAGVQLPEWSKGLKDAGLVIGLVTAPTDMIEATDKRALALFEACAKAGVSQIKIGYFPYSGKYDADVSLGRKRLQGFEKLARSTGVKACYHTHSGPMLGCHGIGLKALLEGFDPHYVGAFLDTGHLAIGGGPFAIESDAVAPWFSILAIKDMAWTQTDEVWKARVVPAGKGFVRWKDVSLALKARGFRGVISLHGEYEAEGTANRVQIAKDEDRFLKNNGI